MRSPPEPLFPLQGNHPPEGCSLASQALWWDARGDWNKAHDLIANEHGRAAARVHAYLHRKEGDPGNARYWYGRAGAEPFTGSLEEEWQLLAKACG